MYDEERDEERRAYHRSTRDLWEPDGMSAPPEEAPAKPGLLERYRANEYAYLAGEELPYPELKHEHEWNSNEYCNVCGADGRA